MKRVAALVLVIVFALSFYHLLRDILQIMDIPFPTTDVWHRPHKWCTPRCDVVTLPLDVAGIVTPILAVVKKWKPKVVFGLTSILVLVWTVALLSP